MTAAAVRLEGLLGGVARLVQGERLALRGRLVQVLAAVAVDDGSQQGQHGQAGHGDQGGHDEHFSRTCVEGDRDKSYGVMCTWIHESDAELICMWFFFPQMF